jgi:Cof subfamily protein (haloacid dehalogenase superfamily)
MLKFKAIITDFDGTLVDSNLQMGKEVEELIGEIKKKGIHFSIATGRPYYQIMRDFLSKHSLDDIHIFCGGGLIIDTKNKKVLWDRPIDSQSVKKITHCLQEKNLFFALETLKCAYLSKPFGVSLYGDPLDRYITEYRDSQKVYKIMVSARLNKMIEKKTDELISKIKKLSNSIEAFKFRSFNNYYGFDVTSIKATKLTTLFEYTKINSISPKEVVAIGDGPNDYPLFMASGFKFAMSQAPKELQEIADLVVSNDKNQGMREALNFLLKKNFL